MSSNTILVTGASGHIGQLLVAELQRKGATVLAGTRSGQTVAGVPARAVDFSDPAALRQAFEGVDTLFLLFPLAPNKLELARNAVAAAKAAGVKHLVRSSGAGADPASPMALGKLQGEIDQLIAQSGIAYTLLRPNSFMQNFVNYYAGMIKSGTVYFSHAQGKVSFIDVADIAAVAAAVLQNPAAHAGQAYTLTGPEALSEAQAMQVISAALGRTVNYVAVPEAAAVKSMKDMGMDDWTVNIMSSLNQVIAAGYAAQVSPAVATLTGRPARAFADFVRDNVGAWR
jgi:uncharacterized protein YbjT (DUF2867 family)